MSKTTRRSLIAICIVILLAAACFAVMPKALAFAAETSSDEVSPLAANALFAGGSGTVADPYLIRNETQLDNIRTLSKYDPITGMYRIKESFRLISTILMTKTWTPIDGHFDGTFDGYNYSIDGLQIEITAETAQNIGLFKNIANGTVRDLFMTSVSVTYPSHAISNSTHYVGAIAGINKGTITNCIVRGSFDTERAYNVSMGGIAGSNDSGTISYCYNYVNVKGSGYVGGIAGQNRYGGTVTWCENYGIIEYNRIEEDRCAAGIVGKNIASFVTNCENNSAINYVGAVTLVAVRPCMAQIVGWNDRGDVRFYTCNGTCKFSPLNNNQQTYCSTGAVGRTTY